MDQTNHNNLAARILAFWFGTPDSADWDRERAMWFTRSEEFDARVRDEFLPAWEAAHAGTDGWSAFFENTEQVAPEAVCARIVLLDQFPRNMFRGSPHAFATDPMARQAARAAVEAGPDLAGAPAPGHFFYLPFGHSGDPAEPAGAVKL